MFAGNRLPCSILAIIISMPNYSDAFTSHAHTSPLIIPSPSTKKLMSNLPTKLTATCFHTPTTLSSRNNNKDNDTTADDVTSKKEQYTRVDDGSPIGVVIVLLGTIYLYYGQSPFTANDSSSVWIVFAMASIAAGLARLFRYVRDQE